MTEHIMDRANKNALRGAVIMTSLTLQSQRLWYEAHPSDPDKADDLARIEAMHDQAVSNYAQIILGLRPEGAEQAPKKSELVMFAALLARLGGEVSVTWAEARRTEGVHVVRYEHPETMSTRFELTAEGLHS